MKNRSAVILVSVTCLFFAFTLGTLWGRTHTSGDVVISHLPDPAPVTTAATIPQSSSASSAEQTTIPATVATLFPININTATQAQLESLPGIGPILAQRILTYRQIHGPFVHCGQLTQVEGIGSKKLEAILDLIIVE